MDHKDEEWLKSLIAADSSGRHPLTPDLFEKMIWLLEHYQHDKGIGNEVNQGDAEELFFSKLHFVGTQSSRIISDVRQYWPAHYSTAHLLMRGRGAAALSIACLHTRRLFGACSVPICLGLCPPGWRSGAGLKSRCCACTGRRRRPTTPTRTWSSGRARRAATSCAASRGRTTTARTRSSRYLEVVAPAAAASLPSLTGVRVRRFWLWRGGVLDLLPE